MNASFVREGIGSHHGFIGRNLHAGNFRKQLAGGKQLLVDVGGRAETFLAHLQRHGDFFQRGIPGALADAVDGALYLTDPVGNRGQRIGDCDAEIVVAMG